MRRAIVSSLAFGLCVTAADLGLGAQRTIAMRMPATVLTSLEGGTLEIALAILLGLLVGPLLLVRFGRFLHAFALAAAWAALARYVALDPSNVKSWILPPVIALVACLLGAAVARRQGDDL